jgi:hypothetical protein
MKAKLTEQVQTRLTAEELAQIEARAAAEQRSVSNCIRQLVKLGMTAADQRRVAA